MDAKGSAVERPSEADGKLISALRQQGRLDDALEAGQHAITLLPDWPGFHYQLVLFHYNVHPSRYR